MKVRGREGTHVDLQSLVAKYLLLLAKDGVDECRSEGLDEILFLLVQISRLSL
jgi:hypothetical protein